MQESKSCNFTISFTLECELIPAWRLESSYFYDHTYHFWLKNQKSDRGISLHKRKLRVSHTYIFLELETDCPITKL